MKGVYSIEYIYTRQGFQYVGLDIPEKDIKIYLSKLKDIVGQEKYQKLVANQKRRDGGGYHITLLSPQEFESKNFNVLDELGKQVTVEYVGLGKVKKNKDEAFFVIVKCAKGNLIRESFGLAKKDFHVTLGFIGKDVHGVSKDETTLIKA